MRDFDKLFSIYSVSLYYFIVFFFCAVFPAHDLYIQLSRYNAWYARLFYLFSCAC